MSDAFDTGLRLDQAPPLSIPLRFFLTAPFFLGAGGVLLLGAGPLCVLSRYTPHTLTLTHLTTLGVLTMTMFGALYQMTPVVAASPVPALAVSRVVHVTLSLGTAFLAAGLLAGSPRLLFLAFGALGVAWLGFVVPVGRALLRSPARLDLSVRGMQLSLGCLFLAGLLGLWMAHGYSGGRFPGPRPAFMTLHMGLALLGWVGTLITAVSLQVLPMFYLSPRLPRREAAALLVIVALSLLVTTLLLGVASGLGGLAAQWIYDWLWLSLLPAALAIWLVAPWLTLRALRARKRKRKDHSLRFWYAGLCYGPAAGVLAGLALGLDDPRFELAFGFVVLYGWALCIVHGMLYRIVPFLVWFHRYSSLVGIAPVPAAGRLIDERWPRITFLLHQALIWLGLSAIVQRSGWLARATGAIMLLLSLSMLVALLSAVRRKPDAFRRDPSTTESS